jgi:hypothetical protein
MVHAFVTLTNLNILTWQRNAGIQCWILTIIEDVKRTGTVHSVDGLTGCVWTYSCDGVTAACVRGIVLECVALWGSIDQGLVANTQLSSKRIMQDTYGTGCSERELLYIAPNEHRMCIIHVLSYSAVCHTRHWSIICDQGIYLHPYSHKLGDASGF